MIDIDIYNNSSDDICTICHDNIEKKQKYQLEECKHTFHTECIVKWFRQYNSKCPCCNDTPSNYYNNKSKYLAIYNYSKRKNANNIIKSKINEISKLQTTLKKLLEELKATRNKSGLFKEITKDITKLNRKIYNTRRSICAKKNNLINNINIIPFIISSK